MQYFDQHAAVQDVRFSVTMRLKMTTVCYFFKHLQNSNKLTSTFLHQAFYCTRFKLNQKTCRPYEYVHFPSMPWARRTSLHGRNVVWLVWLRRKKSGGGGVKEAVLCFFSTLRLRCLKELTHYLVLCPFTGILLCTCSYMTVKWSEVKCLFYLTTVRKPWSHSPSWLSNNVQSLYLNYNNVR